MKIKFGPLFIECNCINSSIPYDFRTQICITNKLMKIKFNNF